MHCRILLLGTLIVLLHIPMGASHAISGIRGPDHGIPIPPDSTYESIPVCHGFGCRTRDTVRLTWAEWLSVAGWFREPAATPEVERDRIRRAIGWMEVLVGNHSPTHKDLPGNELPQTIQRLGQLDCIDESVNTTVYLRLFEKAGYLRHHTVIQEAYRRAFFDQHWAGQIEEAISGKRYVIDSWFQPHGYLPIVQDSDSWQDISVTGALVDNRPENRDYNASSSIWQPRFREGH